MMTEARKAGVDPVTYTQDLLRKALPSGAPGAPSLPAEEASLLKDINQGISLEQMARYQELIRKRQQETISQVEFDELQEFTARLEDLQTLRARSMAKLAKLRGLAPNLSVSPAGSQSGSLPNAKPLRRGKRAESS
jgi:hypothetical protein